MNRIRELGCKAGAALNPSTPIETLRDVVGDLDLLLVMTVNPGFGGQKFIEATVSKIARASGHGGGHRQAAGFSSDDSIEEITNFIRSEFAAARDGA